MEWGLSDFDLLRTLSNQEFGRSLEKLNRLAGQQNNLALIA